MHCPILMGNTSDVVDREPSNGDVYKMLLGSVSKLYDERDDSEPTTPSSAPSRSSEEAAQTSSSPASYEGIQPPQSSHTPDLFPTPSRSNTESSSATVRPNTRSRLNKIEGILKKH
jgi:hypothetical protein